MHIVSLTRFQGCAPEQDAFPQEYAM